MGCDEEMYYGYLYTTEPAQFSWGTPHKFSAAVDTLAAPRQRWPHTIDTQYKVVSTSEARTSEVMRSLLGGVGGGGGASVACQQLIEIHVYTTSEVVYTLSDVEAK